MASASDKASIFRAIAQTRRSTKRFQTGRRIPSETLRDVLQSTLRAPSSFNLQPTQIIMVQDPSVKEQLAQEAMLGIGNQFRARDCSALAFFLADMEAGKRISRIHRLERDWGKRHPTYLAMMPLSSSFLLGEGHAATFLKQMTTQVLSELQPMPQIEPAQAWSYKNTSLAIQSYVLAATSLDLATCLMEGFDARRVKEILRIPDRYGIPMAVATGYDYEEQPSDDKLTRRLPLEEIVFEDTFGVPWDDGIDEREEEISSAGGSS